MNYTVEDFRDICLQLLPSGPAWPRESSSRFGLLFESLMSEFVVINNAMQQLTEEMSPINSSLLFELWEAEYGLPGTCITEVQTIEQRQGALIERHTYVGRQDRQFFIDLANRLGFTITIDEFSALSPGPSGSYAVARESGNLTQVTPVGDDWNFVWRVNASIDALAVREYPGAYGEFYQGARNQLLECTLRHFCHIHRVLIFSYS